ncbi:MAG: Very short patch repair protein [Candidatus Erwinia impunctatus]|nr:Very short patch repair protein [Culicoides impunctatus]
MTDVHDKATRSKNMRAIGNKNTAIERHISQVLEQCGFDYRSQVTDLSGRPDFVIDDYRAIIFTHGCFWHQHYCSLFRLPATRTLFWQQKIAANAERDKRSIADLNCHGWRVLVIWECALRGRYRLSANVLMQRIEEWVCAGQGNASIDTTGIRAES